MLSFQKLLMSVLGVRKLGVNSPDFLAGAIGLSTEAAEVLDILNTRTRPWAATENGEATRIRLAEELTDVMFYLLELFSMLEIDDTQIKHLYGKKLIINISRAFMYYAPTISQRKSALEWFLSDDFFEATETDTILAVSALSAAIDIYYPKHSVADFAVPEFYESPTGFAKKWASEHEPESSLRTL